MQFYTKLLLVIALLSCSVFAQQLPDMRLSESKNFLKNKENFEGYKEQDAKSDYKKNFQLKTRKTVTSYFGAGYSLMIFTNSFMSSAFPILDTRNGTFLTNINLFFGFSIAKAVTLEFSPGYT